MSAHISLPRQPSHYAAGSELLATCGRIVFEGDEGDSVIFSTTDGTKVVCEGGSGSIHEGETYRLLGHYHEDPRWGRQFKAQAFLPHQGHDARGIIKYLTLNAPGIGQARAKALYDAYNSDAVSGLRNHPDVVAADGVLPLEIAKEAAESLRRVAEFEATTIDLHSLFSGRGLGAASIKECIRRWGIRAAERCRRNPYALLLAGIPRAGFATVDRLYLDLGGSPDALKRQALAGWNAVRDAQTGSTWHPYSLFAKGVVEQVGASRANLPRACALAQRARLIVYEDGRGPAGHCADPRQAANERTIAAGIRRLFDRPDSGWRMPAESAVTPHQYAALLAAIESPMMLLTGVPGTGKTYVAAKLLQMAAAVHGQNHIAVAAPTGKAAVRITQALLHNGLSLEATTVHRLLLVSRNGHDGQGWGFEFDADNPLPYRFVAVDESSMLDTDLASSLFAALAPGTNLLLIGDPHQLPPVGHGCPLRDMIAAKLPRAHLTEIKRNSGAVTLACAVINAGQRVEFCERLNIDQGDNLRLIECGDEAAQLEALRSVIVQLQGRPNTNVMDDVQVLTPRNDSSRVSRKQLNDYLQLLMNPEQQTDVKGKAEGFRLRDKVICLSNTVTDKQRFTAGMPIHLCESWQKTQGTLYDEAQCFVANGDMGRVIAVSKSRAEVIVRFDQPQRYVRWRLSGKKADEQKGKGGGKEDLALAYAITGHKSQGSEWPFVLVMLDATGDRVVSKEWSYTVLSRMTKAVILFGRRATFDRQVRRAELPLRKTWLKELILEVDGGKSNGTYVPSDPGVVPLGGKEASDE